MRSIHPLLAVLAMTLSLGAACAPSGNPARQPTAGTDSSPEVTRELSPDVTESAADPVVEPSPLPAEPLPPPVAPRVAPVVTRMAIPQSTGPYRVRVVDENHNPLPTFVSRGRTYVMGTVGARYSVVVANPTGRRVEAVLSVDGIDAMDGHPADYVTKRGYILPAYGDMTVDGFRTSYEEVATFRFSSVADSYAGRLGQPRDVGVIGVAFFPEAPPVVVPEPTIARDVYPAPRPAARRAPAGTESRDELPGPPPPPAPPALHATGGGGAAPSTRSAPSKSSLGAVDEDGRRAAVDRPGLGTEFGEARTSRVGTTSFTRANLRAPRQVVAIRYNDRAGLIALGVVFSPSPAEADVHLRETADPFRENRFAQAPP